MTDGGRLAKADGAQSGFHIEGERLECVRGSPTSTLHPSIRFQCDHLPTITPHGAPASPASPPQGLSIALRSLIGSFGWRDWLVCRRLASHRDVSRQFTSVPLQVHMRATLHPTDPFVLPYHHQGAQRGRISSHWPWWTIYALGHGHSGVDMGPAPS